MDVVSQRHSVVLWTAAWKQRVCHFLVIRSALTVLRKFLGTTVILRHGDSKLRGVGCKEVAVKQAERRKMKNAFEGRHSAISYTAKVNIERSWKPIILPLSGINRLGRHKSDFSRRLRAELFPIVFIELVFSIMWNNSFKWKSSICQWIWGFSTS